MTELADFLRCATCQGIIDQAAGYYDVLVRQPVKRGATPPRPPMLHFCSLLHLIMYGQQSMPLDSTRPVNHVVALCDWCKDLHFPEQRDRKAGPCNQVECQCWCVRQ